MLPTYKVKPFSQVVKSGQAEEMQTVLDLRVAICWNRKCLHCTLCVIFLFFLNGFKCKLFLSSELYQCNFKVHYYVSFILLNGKF